MRGKSVRGFLFHCPDTIRKADCIACEKIIGCKFSRHIHLNCNWQIKKTVSFVLLTYIDIQYIIIHR